MPTYSEKSYSQRLTAKGFRVTFISWTAHKTLATHPAALNADRQYMTLVEDLDHWAEYGIHTPLQLDWYLSLSCVVDMHKDAYGFKGSWAAILPPMPNSAPRSTRWQEIESLGRYRGAIKAEEEEAEYERQLQAYTPVVGGWSLRLLTIGELCSLWITCPLTITLFPVTFISWTMTSATWCPPAKFYYDMAPAPTTRTAWPPTSATSTSANTAYLRRWSSRSNLASKLPPLSCQLTLKKLFTMLDSHPFPCYI